MWFPGHWSNGHLLLLSAKHNHAVRADAKHPRYGSIGEHSQHIEGAAELIGPVSERIGHGVAGMWRQDAEGYLMRDVRAEIDASANDGIKREREEQFQEDDGSCFSSYVTLLIENH